MTTVDEAIEVLNRIHAADPTVLPSLIETRVWCNDALADDPTVQVVEESDDCDPVHVGYRVGLLGVLNGIFGCDQETGFGYIYAHYEDDHHTLTGFGRAPG